MADKTNIDDRQTLRRSDLDRYLSTLYAPQALRQDLDALYRFNAEIAAIRERIREPLPGEVRIQWWRDMLAGGKSAAGGYPLAEAVLSAIERHHLPLDAFDRYLESRIFDLYDDPMPSRADLEGYCGETASVLIQLAALMLEPEAAPSFATAAGHAGCAQAIAGLVRLMPLHRARGQCYVPADILAAAGASREDILSGSESAAARRAVSAFIELGREHDGHFRQAAKGMPATLRPAFLPAGLAGVYLAQATKAEGETLHRVIDISPLRRHWTMLGQAVRGWG